MKQKRIIIITLVISVLLLLCIFVMKKTDNNKNIYNHDAGIPVLMYHGVSDKPWGDTNIFTEVAKFKEQMDFLHNEGYQTLFISEIEEAKNYEKPIIITFDDGYIDVYQNAYPIMKQYNIKSTIFIITNYLDGPYMTKDMVREVSDSNLVEIGSHTKNHKNLSTLNDNELQEEIVTSKQEIEEIINKTIKSFSYPYGSEDEKVQ